MMYQDVVIKNYPWLYFSVVDCGSLESPDNGTVDLSEGTTFGSTAVYSCDEIFVLDGNSTRVCLSSGVWSNEPPTCYCECGSISLWINHMLAHFVCMCVCLQSPSNQSFIVEKGLLSKVCLQTMMTL